MDANSVELEEQAGVEAATDCVARRDSDAAFLLNGNPSGALRRSLADSASAMPQDGPTLSRTLSLTDMAQLEAEEGHVYERSSYEFWHNTLLELGYEKSAESFMERESFDMRSLSFASSSAAAAAASSGKESKQAAPPPTTSASRFKPASRLLRAASRAITTNGRLSPYDSNNDGIADGMVLFQYFDLTPTRMQELFQHWDVDHNGTITYEELLEGL